MAIVDQIKPTQGTWRVVIARWLLYVLAMLPGMLSMTRHLEQTIGVRPWFQDLELPLDLVSMRMVLSELGGGVALLVAGLFVIWLLQLVWLAGSIQILDPRQPGIRKKVFSHGWSFLGRFIRIALFAAIAVAVMNFLIGKAFGFLSARAETEAWPLYVSYITLNQWQVAIVFIVLSLIGIIAFWARIYAVTQDRRDIRRLPWQALKLMWRRPVSALLWQFILVCAVLLTHTIALVSWRQSPNGALWIGIWALLLLLTAYLWQLRIRSAIETATR